MGSDMCRFGTVALPLEIEFRETERYFPIPLKRHRAQRFPFVAGIQITALDTQGHLAAHTEDLNMSGCFVETMNPFIGGTKVGLTVSHDGVAFVAQGTVAYSLSGKGMGIKFTFIEPSSISILDSWLTAQNVTD